MMVLIVIVQRLCLRLYLIEAMSTPDDVYIQFNGSDTTERRKCNGLTENV